MSARKALHFKLPTKRQLAIAIASLPGAQRRRCADALVKNAAKWFSGLTKQPSARDQFMPILSIRTVIVGDKRLAELNECGYVRLKGMCPRNEATHDEVHALVREVIRHRHPVAVHASRPIQCGPPHIIKGPPKRARKGAKP